VSWASLHRESEGLAAEAHGALRLGDANRARELFAAAARKEAMAFAEIGLTRPRTLGAIAVSAVSLWYKAGALAEAEQLAHRAATTEGIPPFAKAELNELLQAVWNEQAQNEAGISFLRGQVVVSVKGGEVVAGGAPLDLILSKVQTVENLFYRTAEFLKSHPLRRKGPPPRELQMRCRPWLFQSVPGSYQFAVAIQQPPQGELFATGEPEPQALTDTFLSILRSVNEDPMDGLNDIVPNVEYRETFLKLTRNLSPSGKSFDQIEVRSVSDRNPVVLSAASRTSISDALRRGSRTNPRAVSDEESTLRGVLRALDLDQDWLEVAVEGVHKRVNGVAEEVDDLLGPMVNHVVSVRVREGKRGRLLFVDIEQEE